MTRRKQTVIQLVAAMSLNGKIANEHGSFTASREDQAWLQKKICGSDLLIMGRKTFDKHVKNAVSKPIIVFTRAVKNLKRARVGSHEVYYFSGQKQDLMRLIDLLQYRIITILGGAEIYHWSLDQHIVTDIYLTIEPFMIGGGKHFLQGKTLQEVGSWTLKSVKPLNDHGTLRLHYVLS